MSLPALNLRKYHGLGNDYLIPTDAQDCAPEEIDAELVRRICEPHYGLGSDGILYGPYFPDTAFFQKLGIPEAICAFRILNPDGSEAEKSGNGVRIFARWLLDSGRVELNQEFVLATLGGPIRCCVKEAEDAIQAQMGKVSFEAEAIPVLKEVGEVLNRHITVGGTDLEYCAATVGNPHCVVLSPAGVSREQAQNLGPLLESHPVFPNRTNVQFMQALDDHTIQIEIYERGAGYTLASGTSASACAAVAVRIGWCQSPVTVVMPGGKLTLQIDEDFQVTQVGPVRLVYDVRYYPTL